MGSKGAGASPTFFTNLCARGRGSARMRVAALALALGLSALLPAGASAYAVGGKAWPGKTIRYYAAARGYASAVDRAARIWKRARGGVRFAASSRRTADVVVAYGTYRCAGEVPMGYGGRYAGTI